jgi:hypothetical protein
MAKREARCYSAHLLSSEEAATKPEPAVVLDYEFHLSNGVRQQFRIRLRRPDLQLMTEVKQPLPDWTRLAYHQCSNCPLRPETHPWCPAAVALVDVIEAFRDTLSTEEAEIRISGENREYRRRAPAQYGVSSLMGLCMVTCGCPILDKLRPMVRTHLPFASIEETMYRLAGMYLLAQYFVQQGGKTPDWSLQKLVRLCEEVGLVNRAFSRRLLSIRPLDASLNALANLDCFTLSTAFSIDKGQLGQLEALFKAYVEPTDASRPADREG